jgi:hypothetical protein
MEKWLPFCDCLSVTFAATKYTFGGAASQREGRGNADAECGMNGRRQALPRGPPHFPAFEAFEWGAGGRRKEIDDKDITFNDMTMLCCKDKGEVVNRGYESQTRE